MWLNESTETITATVTGVPDANTLTVDGTVSLSDTMCLFTSDLVSVQQIKDLRTALGDGVAWIDEPTNNVSRIFNLEALAGFSDGAVLSCSANINNGYVLNVSSIDPDLINIGVIENGNIEEIDVNVGGIEIGETLVIEWSFSNGDLSITANGVTGNLNTSHLSQAYEPAVNYGCTPYASAEGDFIVMLDGTLYIES